MGYSNLLENKISKASQLVKIMIEKAEELDAKNFGMLYTLQDGLQELSNYIMVGRSIDPQFIIKWNSIMGWVPRVFEEHPILQILNEIDTEIIKATT